MAKKQADIVITADQMKAALLAEAKFLDSIAIEDGTMVPTDVLRRVKKAAQEMRKSAKKLNRR